ncbi:MAG: ERF family protein [Taibaiella sp.]|jgi:hypothetical protein
MKNLAMAVMAVMKEVKTIEKNLSVGFGTNRYNAVSDKDVKTSVREVMLNHGLCILPVGINATVHITGRNNAENSIESVLTEVNTEYMLLHECGESLIVKGYGQGLDSGDKGAGMATTYALKYALLNMFLIPTGKIDDADNKHSDEKPSENGLMDQVTKAVAALKDCKNIEDLKDLRYSLSPEVQGHKAFVEAAKNKNAQLLKTKKVAGKHLVPTE